VISNLMLALVLSTSAPDTMLVPLEEIVVTGTRLADSTLRIPAAVSVVGGSRITDSRGLSLKDPLVTVPGVFAQSRAGAQDVRITIRGFGARGNGDRSNAGNMRGIRILTDGIPLTEPDGRTSLDLVDLLSTGRIEVSRTNASTLYGNASGGVIQLRTPLDFERPWTEIVAHGGAYGYHREQLLSGFTIGEARAQFSLLNSTFDGWRDHSESYSTQAQLRVRVPVAPRTNLGVLLDAVGNLNRFPGALTVAEGAETPTMADPAYVSRDERRRNRVGRVGLTFDRALNPSQDLTLTAFAEPKSLQRSERNRFRDFARLHTGGSAEWQIRRSLAPGVSATVSLGGDDAFQDGSILFYNLNPDGSRGTTVVANKREAANSGGVYAQGDVHWSRWRASLAVRGDAIWYIAEDRIDPTLNADETFTRLTPKGSIARLFDRHTIYAALGGGVEAPAFNEIDPPPTAPPSALNPFLDPTHSVTYELGGKGLLPAPFVPGDLQYDAALYWIDVKDDLVSRAGGAYFETVGHTRRRGGELGLRWLPHALVTFDGGLAISNNEYVDYETDSTSAGDGHYGGNQMPGVPDITFAGGVTVRSRMGLEGAVNVQSADGYFADDANTLSIRNFTVLNASIAYERSFASTRLRAFLNGSNLTDADYNESVYINPVPGATPDLTRYVEPGLPANVSFGVSVRFD
jgi:iron complex outermembrane receptor protein